MKLTRAEQDRKNRERRAWRHRITTRIYTDEEIAVFQWYSKRLREDRYCFLRGPEIVDE